MYPESFSHRYSPNWQDHSTTEQCEFIEREVGGPETLAAITGSKAHHVPLSGGEALFIEIHRAADTKIPSAVR
jgi:hypothetical protein